MMREELFGANHISPPFFPTQYLGTISDGCMTVEDVDDPYRHARVKTELTNFTEVALRNKLKPFRY